MFEAYPVELRPVLTRHRLRRRRHRSAATLLTGAALALGLAATRPIPAGAAVTRQAPTQTDSPRTPPRPLTEVSKNVPTQRHPARIALSRPP